MKRKIRQRVNQFLSAVLVFAHSCFSFLCVCVCPFFSLAFMFAHCKANY